MPNLFAYLVLIDWPFLTLVLYRKYQPVVATMVTLLGAYLLLPVKVSFDFPFIPPLNKGAIASITALIVLQYTHRKRMFLIPESGLERWLILLLIITPILTVLNNLEPFYNLGADVKGLTHFDAISAAVRQYIVLIPFILGVHLTKSYKEQIFIFKLIAISGLIYSLPMLLEIRLSPQLHSWVYGFFPHHFGQQIRYSGFRPVVFLGHGLLISMFIAISLGAATALWKQKQRIYGYSFISVMVYFFVLLILVKTLSGFLLGIFLMLTIALLPVYIIKWFSKAIMLLVILYPILLIFDLFPHDQIIGFIEIIDGDRADSLSFRFNQELILLEHAKEKINFGWGGSGRNRAFNSIADGYWIIVFGQFGIVGFSLLFGLAVLGVWRSTKALHFIPGLGERRLLAAHALIVATIMLDQLPNSSLASGFWMWFFIGSLLGRANEVIKNRNQSSIIDVDKNISAP